MRCVTGEEMLWAREAARLVKLLMSWTWFPEFTLRQRSVVVTPVLGSWRQANPWRPLASLLLWPVRGPVLERMAPKNKIWLFSHLHAHGYTCMCLLFTHGHLHTSVHSPGVQLREGKQRKHEPESKRKTLCATLATNVASGSSLCCDSWRLLLPSDAWENSLGRAVVWIIN